MWHLEHLMYITILIHLNNMEEEKFVRGNRKDTCWIGTLFNMEEEKYSFEEVERKTRVGLELYSTWKKRNTRSRK
jgi:hypothetical protein